jgi:hypothetical protein
MSEQVRIKRTALSFAATNVGSTSSDSPKTVTVSNAGNAALTFAVPGTSTNPNISSSFTMSSLTTTCPQISATGSAASLNVGSSCIYGINFAPIASGTISGSLVLTDNALNAVGGTQTIPLSGNGTSKAQIAILAVGPGGSTHVTWVASGTSLANAATSGAKVWVETGSRTFIVGIAEFVADQQGNNTCTEIGPGSLSKVSDLLGGTISPGYGNYVLPNNQCPGQVYQFSTVSYTWGADQADLQDPFTLGWTNPNGQFAGTLSYVAEDAHITVTPATPSGSGANPPLNATASLTNPPANAKSYAWTITGGGGAIVFSNGQETISSTTNSIPIQEPNPTGNSVSFNLNVAVTYATSVGSNTLRYGPLADTFCGAPTTVDVWVNSTSTTTDDITVLNPAFTIPVQLTMHSNPSCGPQTITLSATPAGRISFNQTTFKLADGSAANAVIAPLAVSMSANDVTITATVQGKQVGTAMMTVADVKIPAVRNTDTPTGMPDRIPPRVNTPVHVTVQPDLGTSGQTIHLIPKNNNSTNGDFTINGTTFQDITGTTDVQLQGTTQTAPTAAPGGGNASKLKIDAQVRGQDAVLSSGFSVAAIPQNLTESLFGPAPGYPNILGIRVSINYQSDSGALSDLDQCQWSEQVQVDIETGSLTGLGGGQNSGYLAL